MKVNAIEMQQTAYYGDSLKIRRHLHELRLSIGSKCRNYKSIIYTNIYAPRYCAIMLTISCAYKIMPNKKARIGNFQAIPRNIKTKVGGG